jgi:hypothetical protein
VTLYTLTYRQKQLVKTGFIEASSLQVAERLGRAYCLEQEGRRYIHIQDAILVREDVPQKVQADTPSVSGYAGTPKRAA